MASRLNTRLIALAAIAAIGAVAVVGAFAVLRYRADATRNVRQGDQFMAAGEYAKALGAYGRAVNKQPANLQYLEKAMAALRQVTPETRNDLRERFTQLQAMMERRIGIAPHRAESHRDVIDLRLQLATLGDGSASSWQRLEEAGDRMVNALEEDDPARLDGELYAALGALGRGRLLEPSQFDAAIARLRKVIAARPTDDLASATLAEALIGEGTRRRDANRADVRAGEMIAEGRRHLEQAIERIPDGPMLATLALRDLMVRRIQNDPGVTQEAVDQATERVIGVLAEDPSLWVADRALTSLILTGNRPAIERGLDALADVSRRDPDNIVLRQFLMAVMLEVGRLEECQAQAQWILDAPPRRVGVDAWLQNEGRLQAATALFNIEYERLRRLGTSENASQRASAERALERLRGMVDQPEENPTFLRSRARLAAITERWSDALADFERTIRLVGESSVGPDLQYEAGYAAAQAGESGLARRRLAQALSQSPRFLEALVLQADLEQRAGDLESARRSLALARQVAPGDERVERLGRILEMSGADAVQTALVLAEQRFDRGDLEGSARLLAEALAKWPEDVRLHRAATFVELSAGRSERAAELARAGLALEPNDQLLTRALVIVDSRDPVERVERSIEAEVPEGPVRTARIYAALVRLSHATTTAAAAAARAGSPNAEALEADAGRLREAVARYRAQANAITPAPPLVLRTNFEESIRGGRFDEAAELLRKDEAAATPVLSAAERALMQTELLLSQSDRPETTPAQRREFLARAVQTLEAAIRRNPESAELHRQLGQTYARTGNLPAAQAALEIAYAQRPTDMGVVEAYASVLQSMGEQQRLLAVLRTAARQRDVSPAVRAAWLAAEGAIGDRRTALEERRALHRTVPDDLPNGVALAAMLLTLPPSRELMIDPQGRERIPADRWAAMGEAQQRAALEGLRREWIEETRRVAQTLGQHHPRAFEVATVRADLERAAGRPEAGLAVLREFVESAGDDVTSQVLLTFGSYQEALGRESDAFAAYEKALRKQSAMREADRFLAMRAIEAGRYDVALPHLKAVAAASETQADRLRVAEALGRVGELDQAEASLKEIVDTYGLDADCAMLDASLAERRIDIAAREGRTTALPALQDRMRTSIRRAQELRPTDPVPIVGEAQAILAAWQRKPQRQSSDREVDEALTLLERSLALRADHWPAIKLRAGLLADRGDLTSARAELERYIKLRPQADEARMALIDLWMRSGQIDRAIAVAREGVEFRPFDARMRRTLGDLYDRSGNLPAAILEHARAAEIQPSGGTERLVMLLLRDTPTHQPEFSRVLQLLESRPEELKRSVYLESAMAAAKANSGQRPEGLQRLAKVYAEYSSSAASRPELINGWFDMVWLAFPTPARLADAEAFVRETTGGKPAPFDLRELAIRHTRVGPSGLERAKELLQQAISESAGVPPASRALLFFDLGNVLYAMGRCAEAVPVFEEGLSLLPNSPGIMNNLAYLMATCLNDPARALPLIQRAVSLVPSDWAFRDTLGEVHARLGQVEAAEREFRASLALSRQTSTSIKLAQLLAANGRKSEARVELRRASEADPKAKDLPEFIAADAASR